MKSIFTAFNASVIGSLCFQAKRRIVYAAPGIQAEAAEALSAVAKLLPPEAITISVDFDEHTLRMGYGSLSAIETLRAAGINPTHSPGFRCGILIVDERGWIFTPTALYLESEPQSEETPNAIEVTPEQLSALLPILSPQARAESIAAAITPEVAAALNAMPLEIGLNPIASRDLAQVKEAITMAPPVKFDVARQVRVFEPYLEYVEIKLTGAAIQSHKVALPKNLQQIGGKELKERLRTTFALIEKDDQFSSKSINDQVAELRNNFAPSLGERFGRVMLKKHRGLFEERIAALKAELKLFQATVKAGLQKKLDSSKELIAKYFVPILLKNPPDALLARVLEMNETSVAQWVHTELQKAFPSAEALVKEMSLEVQFKDVTWETLNDKDFGSSLRKAFPATNWDKPFHDFQAASASSE